MSNDISKTYGYIGKGLCGIAGAIVGFVSFGPLAAVIGFFIGISIGHLLEKAVVNPRKAQESK